jgi:hypothetical protein
MPRRAHPKVIEGFAKKEIHAVILGAVAPATELATDDWPSYQNIPKSPTARSPSVLWPARIVLLYIRRLFSNLKRRRLAVYTDCAE